jgi:hypothetical protein
MSSMAARSSEKSVLWPDLTQYGATLSVAFNPSIGRNFLKFSVLDRETYQRESGAEGDLNSLMRQAGFTLCANETTVNQIRAYTEAVRLGLAHDAVDQSQRDALEAIFFYSPTIAFNRERLRTFLPALRDSDLRQVPVASIKHYDFAFLDADTSRTFIEEQQRLAGASPGIFYTTPADRALQAQFAQSTNSLNEFLEYRDLPPVSSRGLVFEGGMEEVLEFHPSNVLERSVRRQTIGIDGMPLRAPAMACVSVGYASFDLAVSANGGSAEGVETANLPNAVPVAFTAPHARLMLLNDARFLEFNALAIPEHDADRPVNVQRNIEFLSHLEQVQTAYRTLKQAGLLDPAQWSTLDVAADVKAQFEGVFSEMKNALASAMPTQGFFTVDAIALLGSQRAERFEEHFEPGFLRFIDDFRTNLYNAAQRRHDELAAQISFKTGMDRVMRGALSAAPEVQPLTQSEVPDASPVTRREDAGEKIGGARKDYALRALRRSEVASLSIRERQQIVTKDNVWPRLDMEAMRDRGVEPHVAYIIREIRHALPTNPTRGGRNRQRADLEKRSLEELSDERCDWFVRAVELVRDSLAEVKSESDLPRAFFEIFKHADLPIGLTSDAGGRGSRMALYSGSPDHYYWTANHWFFDGAGKRFRDTVLPDLQFDAAAQMPVAGHRLTARIEAAKVSTEGRWTWAVKDRAAEADAEGPADTLEQVVKTRIEPRMAHLAHIERTGADRRKGADVDEALFMSSYGFRAIEYGKWLPQSERQTVLNHAFDAFADLADTLGLRHDAVSLNGELAIAFGARGSGGKNAASAHYEPARVVMNLTRLSGAGKLAHEWWHAFDDWLARSSGLSGGHYATELLMKLGNRRASPLALPPVVNDLTSVLVSAKTVATPLDEVIDNYSTVKVDDERLRVDVFVERRLNDWVSMFDRMLPDAQRDGTFKEWARAAMSGHWSDVPGFEDLGIRRFARMHEYVDSVCDAMDTASGSDKWRKEARAHLSYPRLFDSVQERLLKKLTNVRETYSPQKHRKNSTFFNDSIFFDEQRSKPYWSTDIELSARLFETWVQDRIGATGERSDYLVHGCEDGDSDEHSAYPRGVERKDVNRAVEAYFERHRHALAQMLERPRQSEKGAGAVATNFLQP